MIDLYNLQDIPQASGSTPHELPSQSTYPELASNLPSADPQTPPAIDQHYERYECETADLDNLFEVASLSLQLNGDPAGRSRSEAGLRIKPGVTKKG